MHNAKFNFKTRRAERSDTPLLLSCFGPPYKHFLTFDIVMKNTQRNLHCLHLFFLFYLCALFF